MPHRLLLADDSVTIQRVIELTFADEDVQVVAVSDGEAAIARLESEPFDIVLADIGMPKRGGYEIAEFIRSRPPLATIPVVLLTGAFDPVDQARVQAAGCAAVLVKPFEPQMVIARVRELLKTGRARPGAGVADGGAAGETVAAGAPLASRGQPAEPGASVDDYFARLDQAFAALDPSLEARGSGPAPRDRREPNPGRPAPQPPVTIETTSQTAPAIPPPASDEWQELPLPAENPGADPSSPPPQAADSADVPPEPSVLAETFSTLLAVERGELPASALPAPGAGEITDEMIDRLARRVAERLGESVVRDLAADIVSRTAERLVRDEIERIKCGIPGEH